MPLDGQAIDAVVCLCRTQVQRFPEETGKGTGAKRQLL